MSFGKDKTRVCGYIYIYISLVLFMYFYIYLCSLISWKQFNLFTFFCRYLLGQSLIQISLKTSAGSFWVILRLILVVLLRAVKPFLIKTCKDVFCITPMLTAPKQIFTVSPLLLKAFLGYVGLFCSIFLYFLRTVWFPIKFCIYILDNNLMVVKLKNVMGCIALSLGLFWVLFYLGQGFFSIFLYFLRKVRYVFTKCCKDILDTLAITQKIIWHVAFIWQGYFKVFWGPFLSIYSSPSLCLEKPWIFPWCFAQTFWSLRKKIVCLGHFRLI